MCESWNRIGKGRKKSASDRRRSTGKSYNQLPVKGLQQLIKTIGRVKKQLNPKLKIEGILLTMVDNRTNYARDISLMVYDTYSASIKVFGTEIPMSVRASEVSVEGGSIYSYDI